MRKTGLLLAAAMVASMLSAGPARADHDIVPPRANIEDPEGDANGLNDQGFSGIIGFQGDNEGGHSLASADIRKVWFSNTAQRVMVHILTIEPPTSSDMGTAFEVATGDRCVVFEAVFPGANYQGESRATVRTPPSEECGGTVPIPGAVQVRELSGGRGFTTLSFGMFSHPALAPGNRFQAPTASSSVITGSQEGGALAGPQIDNTKEGLSYRIEDPSSVQAQGHGPKAGKKTPVKNGCPGGKNEDKGKGNKYGCDKGKGRD